jgi:hypothetical protein
MKPALLTLVITLACAAQPVPRPGTNYDEAKVPQYSLPDPLLLANGERVKDVKTWTEKRRPEIFKLIESRMFGRAPERAERPAFEVMSDDARALNGTARRKQVLLTISGKKVPLLLYLPPQARGRVPVFLALNFGGNHTVHADPGITLAEEWIQEPVTKTYVKKLAGESRRGAAASRWSVERILSRGYGLAVLYYGDIEPDNANGYAGGIRPAFLIAGQAKPAADEWGSIAAWAYGLSRAMDYLETDKAVDAKHIAVFGHSRLGKTALWAGATDPRFAMVISNDSGEGGAAISRRIFGEQVKNLNTNFPHWFCENYRQYNDKEATLPFDSHMLIALCAPRPVYVASAEQDYWADPKGEFLGAAGAEPVYALFGKKGTGTSEMPAIHQPVGDTVRYHVRAGKHDVTDYDWQQYLDFADRHWKK